MPDAFTNGMSEAEQAELTDIIIELKSMVVRVQDNLPRHRNYSVAITKLEEAEHWLRDRWHKPA